MTYAELAKERDDLKYENEMLRSIMDQMLERGKSLEAENEKMKKDSEPVRHGHWIVHERAEAVFGLIIPNFECSECHTWVRPDGRGKRCLECGAKMDGKENEK